MSIVRIAGNSPSELERCFRLIVENRLFYDSMAQYDKWHWKFVANPFCSSAAVPVFLFMVDRAVAGQLGVMPVALKIGTERLNAGWAVDFKTLPEYRNRGIGKALVQEASRSFDVLLTLGQTDMSYSLFLKMGWKLIGHLPYYLAIYDSHALVRERIGNDYMAKPAAIAANLLLKGFRHVKKIKTPQDIQVSEIERFDDEADELWREIASCDTAMVPRDLSYLRWKYDIQPGMSYRKVRASRNRKACGYAIVRIVKGRAGEKEGLIADIVASPDDRASIEALLCAAMGLLEAEDCSIARCYFSNRSIGDVLERSGFIKGRATARLLVSRDMPGLTGPDDLHKWYMSAGDCDMDR